MIDYERAITHHTVTLGALTRAGDALAEFTEQDTEGTQQTRVVHVPAGLPGERVTIAIEAPPQPDRGSIAAAGNRVPRVSGSRRLSKLHRCV